MNRPKHLPEIPERMKKLPIDDRGYPIPYFVATREDGSRDFRFADGKKQTTCIKYSKCWICGNPIKSGIFYFISGPIGLMNKTCSDAGMHEDCARFSLFACPHMYFEKAERGSDRNPELQALDKNHSAHYPNKPSELYLIKSDRQDHYTKGGVSLIQFRPIGDPELFIYQNGRLIAFKEASYAQYVADQVSDPTYQAMIEENFGPFKSEEE